MKLSFTASQLEACMEESKTFRNVIAYNLSNVETEFESVAREAYSKDGIISAIKAVRTLAMTTPEKDSHRYYSLKEAKDFVEKVCNHKRLV